MSLIKGTALHGYRELVVELGGDPDQLLSKAHLDGAATEDPDRFIDYRSAISALELAARATSAWDFGRKLGARQGLDILGPVGVAARTAENVGAALTAVDRYMTVYSPALKIAIDPQVGQRYARFDWRMGPDNAPAHPQAAELGLAVSARIFRLLAGGDFRPSTVYFQHQPLTDTADYLRDFGCPVRFGAVSTGFLFDRSILLRPLSADSTVHELVREYLDTIIAAAPPTAPTHLVDQVRLIIRRTLPTGGVSLELVASHLALHPRTLQRRLAELEYSFATLADTVRREEAERYLGETNLPLSGLATTLGYSEQSVLARSCQRWFGASPSAVRRRLQGR